MVVVVYVTVEVPVTAGIESRVMYYLCMRVCVVCMCVGERERGKERGRKGGREEGMEG